MNSRVFLCLYVCVFILTGVLTYLVINAKIQVIIICKRVNQHALRMSLIALRSQWAGS